MVNVESGKRDSYRCLSPKKARDDDEIDQGEGAVYFSEEKENGEQK
jgi:hypothetical protein